MFEKGNKKGNGWKIGLTASLANLGLFTIPLWAAAKALAAPAAKAAPATKMATATGKILSLAVGVANGGGYIGIGLAMGLAAIGAGVAVGYVGAAVVGVVSEKPENLGKMLIFLGIAEGIAIYGFLFAIIILVRLH